MILKKQEHSDVTIVLGISNHIALGLIAEVYVHRKDSYEKMSKEEASTNPIEPGPYEFVKWDKGSQIVMKKAANPPIPTIRKYYLESNPRSFHKNC